MNNIITEPKSSDEEKIKLARLSALLNALGFYKGVAYWNRYDYKDIAGMWLQKNLLWIKKFLIEKQKEKNGNGITHIKKMESRILKYFDCVDKNYLEDIVFENFSFLDEELKNKIKYRTDVYLFSNKQKKIIYVVLDCAKMGEFSASIANSICDQGLEFENEKTGITKEHLEAQNVVKKFIEQYKKNNEIYEMIIIGYSYGGSKALYIYLSDCNEKNKCVLINSLFLTKKSIDYLKKVKKIDDNKFKMLTEKIFNVNSVDDPVSYASKNLFGWIIYFLSGKNKECDEHDITNMNLSSTAKESSNSIVQRMVFLLLNDNSVSYDKIKGIFESFEKFSGAKEDINGNKLEYRLSDLFGGVFSIGKAFFGSLFSNRFNSMQMNLANKIIYVEKTQRKKESPLEKVNELKNKNQNSIYPESVGNYLSDEI